MANNSKRQNHLVNHNLKHHLSPLFLKGVVEYVHKLPGWTLIKERQHHVNIQHYNIQPAQLVTTMAYSYFHFSSLVKSKHHIEKTWNEILCFSLNETYSKKYSRSTSTTLPTPSLFSGTCQHYQKKILRNKVLRLTS